MQVFSAPIVKLGINACVNVPEKIVKSLLAAACKKSAAGCDIGDKVKIHLAYDPAVRMPPMPEPFRQALRGDPNLQKAWRLRPSAKRREILESLNDKKSSTALARGIAETIELLLKKR